MGASGRTSENTPAPTTSPLELTSDGIITSPAWLAWLKRTVSRILQIALDERTLSAYQPAPGRDMEPEILEGAEQVLPSPSDRALVEIDEAARLTFADGAGGALESRVEDLERQSAAAEGKRGWTAELDELRALLAFADLPRASDIAGTGLVIIDTNANRVNYPAANYVGRLYYESDRTVLYLSIDVAGAADWMYIAGEMSGTLASLPPALLTSDVGFRYAATDYGHVYRWSGATWAFAAGDNSSGQGTFSLSSPQPTALWASVAVGGGSVTVAQPGGITASVAYGAYTTPGAGYLLWVRK